MGKSRSFLEGIVIVAIVLVLVQTFLEDLAVLLSWNGDLRTLLTITGFAFDLFFTIEFAVRSYDASRRGMFSRYFWNERGWIDFLASIPLVMLNSGPRLLALLAGGVPVGGVGGMLNVLKVVKAIRITRVLRLLRILKVFKKIKNTDSQMAQRHVAFITASAVTTIVFTLIILSVAGMFVTVPTFEVAYRESARESLDYILSEDLSSPRRVPSLEAYAESRREIISVERAGDVLYSRYNQEYLDRYFTSQDYTYAETGNLRLFLDLRPVHQEEARRNLQYFAVILALVIVFMMYYSPHFALTVTDPIHVMRRGMSEKAYSLEVVIPDRYRDDDIYRLADTYNSVFLPMKDRDGASQESESGSALSVADISGLFDEEE